jgi:NAD(P)-dependent dehydrogenase (short-subunit alcohol dehydrogenase family)
MARVFISGSSTGLGLLAGKELLASGHDVVFHARNAARAEDLRREVPQATSIVAGDIGTIGGALDIAKQVNAYGAMDAVIHNAGVGYGGNPKRTAEGFPDIMAVNVLAPYILTSVMIRAKRLVYLSSGMHRAEPHLEDILWQTRRWNGSLAYSESKLYVTALSFAVARLCPDVRSNAVDPGWVPTRMGGAGAPDDLGKGAATQVALATSDDSRLSRLTGQYLHHMAPREPIRVARDVAFQDRLLDLCRELTGMALPP